MIYLDMQNAYNYKNTGQDFITREKNNDGTYKTINEGSQYVLQSSPNKTGTILPTLGIMVKFWFVILQAFLTLPIFLT